MADGQDVSHSAQPALVLILFYVISLGGALRAGN
jgi:hypothetical protein